MRVFAILPVFFLGATYLLEGAFPQVRGRLQRLSHAQQNIFVALLGVAGSLAVLFFALPLLDKAQANRFGLLRQVSLSAGAGLACAIVMLDAWMYLWHRCNHRLPILWLLHRCHHNDIAMDSTTALRFHPLEIIISSLLNSAVLILLGIEIRNYFVYTAFLQASIFFHHSNICIPARWDALLNYSIVTPGMHRVHHSVEERQTDSNYSSVFSFWDRAFKSFRRKDDGQEIVYGLPVFRQAQWQNAVGCLKIPFQRDAG